MKTIPIYIIGLASLIVLGIGLSIPIRVALYDYQPTGGQNGVSLFLCLAGGVGFIGSMLTIADDLK
jgi:hypothetical protein